MNPFRAKRAQALVEDLADPQRPQPVALTPVPKIDGTTASIRLYDVIDSWGGYWGISAKEFNSALDELPSDVTEIRVLINSPGGTVTEGIAILNALRAHPAKTVAVVEGLAASSASFIAAGCDETVMMRGTEMFIHNAWTITWGDAADLREEADILENHFDRNIAQVYADKTGKTVDYWLGEMGKDLFLNADEAVDAGLADRVEGAPSDAAAKARAEFDLSVFARGGRGAAATLNTPKPPSSTEPVEPNQKEDVVAYDDLKAGLATRLGVTDAAADDETLLAALDEALEEQPEPTNAVPEGAVVIDSGVLATLQSDAAAGRAALEQQTKERRDGIIAAALKDGRISPANSAKWRERLDENEDGIRDLIEDMPKGSAVPTSELGNSDDISNEEDRAYAAVFGDSKKEA